MARPLGANYAAIARMTVVGAQPAVCLVCSMSRRVHKVSHLEREPVTRAQTTLTNGYERTRWGVVVWLGEQHIKDFRGMKHLLKQFAAFVALCRAFFYLRYS